MTTDAQRLTALLGRLTAAGAPLIYCKFNLTSPVWTFEFPDGSSFPIREFDDFPFSERATLLGWAVQQIEALGFTRGVQFYKDGGLVCEVSVQHSDSYVAIPYQAPTELEATLISLAEILESK